MFTQINNFITWFDGVVLGTSADHSDPVHRNSVNRSVRPFTGKASRKSTEIHG